MPNYIKAPPGFDIEPYIANATKVIKDYTAIFIFEDGRVGSGTFVNVCGVDGILTAHHVAKVVFNFPLLVLCIAEHPHSLGVRSEHLEHVVIGQSSENPALQKDGPDLSFLIIRDSNLIEILRSLKSFCFLESQKTGFFNGPLNGSAWAIAGSPHESYRKISEDPKNGPLAKLENFVGAGAFHSRKIQGDFDYIEIIIASGQGDFPRSYKGVSGGGFWLMPIEIDDKEDLNTVSHGNPLLAGVAFYDRGPEDGWRVITGHGFDSIYSRVVTTLNQSRTNTPRP